MVIWFDWRAWGPLFRIRDRIQMLCEFGTLRTRYGPVPIFTAPGLLLLRLWVANSLSGYFLPGEPGSAIARFVDYNNHERYHESLHNPTPAEVYIRRHAKIFDMRQRIKQRTLAQRRWLHYQQKIA